MSNLTTIMNHALGSTSLKRIKFKRDPGNLRIHRVLRRLHTGRR